MTGRRWSVSAGTLSVSPGKCPQLLDLHLCVETCQPHVDWSVQELAECRHKGGEERVDEETEPDPGGPADVAARDLL